jgi:hypothetical protein
MTAVVEGAERFMDGLGLMTGPYAVVQRAAFGALAGAFVITYLKPSFAFQGGQPKPWSLLATNENAADSTPIPWWSAPLLGAFIAGVLV